jgi:PAS domain S-box-containing protein
MTRLPLWARCLLFALVYFACAWLGDYLTIKPAFFCTFWPNSGLFLAVLLLAPTRRWPLYVLAAISANIAFDLMHDRSVWLCLAFASANCTEAVLGAILVRWLCRGSRALASVRWLFGFLLGSIVATMTGAIIGASSVSLNFDAYWPAEWLRWWTANFLGAIMVGATILSLTTSEERKPLSVARTVEWAGLLAAGGILAFFVFRQHSFSPGFKFTLVPIMLWAALRFGIRGTCLSMATLSVIGVWARVWCAPMSEVQPELSLATSVFVIQGFLSLWMVCGLLLAVIYTDAQLARDLLAKEEQRLSLVLGSIDDLVFEFDLAGRFAAWHGRGSDRLYLPPDRFLGKHHREVLPAEVSGRLHSALEAISGGSEMESFEYCLLVEGKQQWSHAVVTARQGSDGTCVGYTVVSRNVTERKLAEDAIRISEMRLRLALKATNDVIWDWDVAQDSQVWNPVGAQVFGWTDITEAPQTAAWWVERVHPNDRQRVSDKFHAAVEDSGQTHWQDEYRFRRADGQYAVVLDRGYISRDERGQAVRMIGAMMDVTERRQAEAALRSSEERYRSIVEHVNDGFYIHDFLGNIIDVNENACHMLGYRREELVGSDLAMIDGPGNTRQLPARMKELIETGRVEFDGEHVHKNGHIVAVSVSVRVVSRAGNGVVQSFVRDITDRKRAEEALRKRGAQLSNALHMGRMGHWELDVASGMFTFSDSFYAIFRTTAAEVGGYQMSIAEYARRFVHPDDAHQVEKETRKAIETDEPGYGRYVEHRMLYADGNVGHIAVRFSVVKDEKGRTIKTYGVNQDITERKQAEAAVRESEERFRSLIESAPDAVFVQSGGRFVYVNSSMVRLMGAAKPEDLLGRDFLAHMAPEYREAIRERVRFQRETGKAAPISEQEYLRLDGSRVPVETTAVAIRYQGRDAHVVFIRDITERRHTEDALREKHEQYLALTENTPDTIMRFDRKFRHLFVNRAVEAATGIPPADFLGRTHREMGFPEDQCLFWERHIRQVFDTGLPIETEFEYPGTRGSRIFDWRLFPETDNTRQVASVLSVARDVTTHRSAIAEYRSLFNRMLDAFALHEIVRDDAGRPIDYRFLAVNPAFEKLTGLHAADIIGRTASKVLPGLDPEWVTIYGQVVDTGKAADFERYSSELNRHFWISAYRPMKDQFACIFSDITERKRAEVERNRFFTMATDMMCIAGFDGTIRQVNPAWTVSLGWSPAELTSRPWLEFVHPEDREATVRASKQLADGRSLLDFQNRYRCKDGSYRWLSWNSFPVVADNSIFSVVRDITESRRNQDMLREKEERFRQFFEHITVGLAVYQAVDDGRDFVFTDMNPAGQRLSKVTLDDVRGRRLTEVFPGARELGLVDALHRAWRTGDSQFVPMRSYRDGRITQWVENRVFRLPSGLVVAAYDDRTEQHRLEEQVRQGEKLQVIGQLAGGVAHDFNNHLVAIMGYADILRMRATDRNVKEMAESIAKVAERSAELTRQLLTFARKGQHVIVPVSINRIAGEVASMLEHSIDKRIRIFVRTEAATGSDTVAGDPAQLHSAVLNMAINARDAMPDGGDMVIATDVVELATADLTGPLAELGPGWHVRLSVRDTGVGMDEATLRHLFEPFFTTKQQGTGMGLAAVYGAVNSHHGAIVVQSEPEKGSLFTIYLPLTEELSEDSVKKPGCANAGRHPRILLVEDEPSVREATTLMLTSLDCQVMVCSSGAEAIDLYRSHQAEIDLVLLDMVMPEMGGPEVLRALRTINPAVRVLLASGYSQDGEARALLGEGACGFLQKPFRTAELDRAVSSALAPE